MIKTMIKISKQHINKVKKIFFLLFYLFFLFPNTGNANNFHDILLSLNAGSYCEKIDGKRNNALVYTDGVEKKIQKDNWSCVIIDGFFSNIFYGEKSLFSVLMMSVSFVIYYVAALFLAYFLFRVFFNMAVNGSFLGRSENNAVFIRVLLGVMLLFPMKNSNSLFIHHVTYAVINNSISLANQIYNQMLNKGNPPKGWAKGLYDYSFKVNEQEFFNIKGENENISINRLQEKAAGVTEKATLQMNIFHKLFVPTMIPLWGWKKFGLPTATVNAVVDTYFKLYLIFFMITGWFPVMIFLIGVPLVSLFTFFSVFFGWLYSSIELMLFAPVICLGLMWPFSDGESFLGKISPAIYFCLGVFLLPSIAIISYKAVIVILEGIITVFSYYDPFLSFLKLLSYYFNVLPLPDISSLDLLGRAEFLVYSMVLYTIIMRCFLFIRIIANSFLKYLGDNSGSSVDKFAVGDSFANVLKTVANMLQKPAPGVVSLTPKNKQQRERKSK